MSGNNSGWNRPAANQPTVKKGGAKVPSVWKGIAAGLAVAVPLVALLVWMFAGGGDDGRTTPDVARGRIKEVSPAKARDKADRANRPASEGTQAAPQDRAEPGQHDKASETEKPKPVVVVPYSGKTIADEIFTNHSDVAIAHLLNLEPGTSILGTYYYGPDFEKDFLAAQDRQIVINADDSDEVRALKEAVIEARKELMTRYKLGEDICKVMSETRQELQQLGIYRQKLEQEVSKIATDDGKLSEKDANDLVEAANLMLKEHGAKPIEMPVFLKYKFQQMKDGEADEGEYE